MLVSFGVGCLGEDLSFEVLRRRATPSGLTFNDTIYGADLPLVRYLIPWVPLDVAPLFLFHIDI